MPPTISLDAHKDQVLALYADKVALPVICKTLGDEHGIKITSKTLRRRIDDWGFKGGRVAFRSVKDATLRERVRKYVVEDKIPTKVATDPLPITHGSRNADSDEQKILEILANDGIQMSDTTLRRMRKDLGIVLRHDDPERLARHRDRMRLRRQLEIKLDGQLPARYV